MNTEATGTERIHMLAKVNAICPEQVVRDLGKVDSIITLDEGTGP